MAELPMAQPDGRPSAAAVRNALADAYASELGKTAPVRALEWMLSQSWLETAQGAALWQHNVGNISAGASWKGDIWRPTWYAPGPAATARTLRLHELMLEGKAPRAFRAYATLEAGARDYVRRLKFDFPTLLRAMQTSDRASVVAEAIRQSRYCPDCEEKATAASLERLRRQLRSEGVFPDAPQPSLVPGGDGAPLAVALVLGYFAFNWAKTPRRSPA